MHTMNHQSLLKLAKWLVIMHKQEFRLLSSANLVEEVLLQ